MFLSITSSNIYIFYQYFVGSLADNNTLSTKIEAKEEKLKEVNDALVERDFIISTLSDSNKELLQQIESLESNVKSLDIDVQNLQNRGAQLVSEKAEKTRLLEKEKSEKTRQVSEYRVSKYICTCITYLGIIEW